jgi:glycosyltransferase involved in cell wall biosynthesis
MRELMISLDQNIFNPASQTAQRMVEYEKNNQLTILIPSAREVQQKLGNDIVVAGSGGANKLSQFFRLLNLSSRLLAERNIQRITTQDPFFIGMIGVRLKKKNPSITFEVQLHGDFYSSDFFRKSGFMNLIRYYISTSYVLKKADTIRVAGERIKKSLLAMGVPEDKITVRSVLTARDDLNRAQHRTRHDLHAIYPQFEKIFIFLGRLEPVKNLPWLIAVFKHVLEKRPSYGLLIVGNGSQKLRLRQQVDRLGLKNQIIFEDWTNDPLSYIKTADAVVFPSLSEGYGLVPMEAASLGVPLIMTDVGVAHYELKESAHVRIVPVGDSDAFLAALLAL